MVPGCGGSGSECGRDPRAQVNHGPASRALGGTLLPDLRRHEVPGILRMCDDEQQPVGLRIPHLYAPVVRGDDLPAALRERGRPRTATQAAVRPPGARAARVGQLMRPDELAKRACSASLGCRARASMNAVL